MSNCGCNLRTTAFGHRRTCTAVKLGHVPRVGRGLLNVLQAHAVPYGCLPEGQRGLQGGPAAVGVRPQRHVGAHSSPHSGQQPRVGRGVGPGRVGTRGHSMCRSGEGRQQLRNYPTEQRSQRVAQQEWHLQGTCRREAHLRQGLAVTGWLVTTRSLFPGKRGPGAGLPTSDGTKCHRRGPSPCRLVHAPCLSCVWYHVPHPPARHLDLDGGVPRRHKLLRARHRRRHRLLLADTLPGRRRQQPVHVHQARALHANADAA